MTINTAARLDLRLNPVDKDRIARAAALCGVPVSAFVRDAALREAAAIIAHAPGARSLSERLRGRATMRMSADKIMQLTRGP